MRTLDQPAPLEQLKSPTHSGRAPVKRLYTGKTLLQLFMVCAFPLHLWTLLMAFRDFGWVALRTDAWDALGLVAYALVIALLESAAVFFVTVLLGLLVPWSWPAEKRAALLGMLVLLISAWSVLAKLYSLYGLPIPASLQQFLVQAGHPLRYVWGFVFLLVAASILLPTIWIVRSARLQEGLLSVYERLVTLSSLYLFLDFLGLVVIATRNFLLMRGAG